METKKFKQRFITFLVAIRSKCAFDIDWPVPNKTYVSKEISVLTNFGPARFFLTTGDKNMTYKNLLQSY